MLCTGSIPNSGGIVFPLPGNFCKQRQTQLEAELKLICATHSLKQHSSITPSFEGQQFPWRVVQFLWALH
jgi:hypothetical protein